MRRSLIEYLESFESRVRDIAYLDLRGYRRVPSTYAEIGRLARQFARELEVREIGKGERVLIWGDNCAEWAAAFWGCALRGIVVVPMDRTASPDFASRVSRQVQARLLVCSRGQQEAGLALPAFLLESLKESVARHLPVPYPPADAQPEDILEIVFTSGTTAEPRGVVISHANILASLQPVEAEISKYLKYERIFHPIRFLNPLPLSHLFGQFVGIFAPQLIGGMVIFQDTLNPSQLLRAIKGNKVSVLVAVPRILDSLKEKIERDYEASGELEEFHQQLEASGREHALWRWWRFRRVHGRFGWKFWAFICSSASLDREVETFWRRLGFAVVQAYGLTETSLISLTHPFQSGRFSIGKALPGREIKLDQNGEILVRGDSVAAAYWQGRELQPVKDEEGWFRTGDMGELDGQGNLHFKGRKKDVIVTAEGMNVYPEDLEETLRRQPEVEDCVVVGRSRKGNAEPCAALILRDPGHDPEAAVKRANRSLAEYQHIRHWMVWPEGDFPRTSTQKPLKRVIVKAVEDHFEKKACPEKRSSPVADLIAEITGQEPEQLSAATDLVTDLELSSIERVELLAALEDRCQVELDETRFTATTTLGELERMLRERPAQPSFYVYPRWAQRWPATWIRLAGYYLLIWPAALLLGYPAIHGRENLRRVKGPVLLVANHVTFLDPGLILAALPRHLRHRVAIAMAGERLQEMRVPPAHLGLFRRWMSRAGYILAVTLVNVFPLPQKSGFRESFAFAGESADRGYSILVFPEGERTRDGKVAPFRAGVGLLVKKLNLPVVPLRIDGLFELKQAGRWAAPPGKVKITVGSPIEFEAEADPERMACQLQDVVESLHRA